MKTFALKVHKMTRQEWWRENIQPWAEGWPPLDEEMSLWKEALEKGWPEVAEDVCRYFTDNRYNAMLDLQDILLGF